jgi:phytoene dehydrogenase-like protein
MSAGRHDVVVIGAGHNGLTCACYLAKAGLSVLVLEANDEIGGLTVTQEITRPGFHSDLHAFGYQFASLSPAPAELDLVAHGLELLHPDVAFANAFPDGSSIRMHADVEQTCASIAAVAPADADAWRALYQRWLATKDAIADGLNRPPGPLSDHLAALEREPGGLDEYRFSVQSMRAWSAEQFVDERVRLFLGAFSLHANVAPDEVGGGQLAWLFDSIIQDFGNRIVRGGMAGVPAALARCLEEHGGEIRTGARVDEIVVEHGRATAVRLAGGDVIPVGRLVASNVDPRTLVVDLLGRDAVGDEIVGKIERYDWGDSIMVIYLALEEPFAFRAGPGVERACYVHCMPPSLEYVAQMFTEVRAGALPAGPVMIVCNDGAADPSRVPAGKGLVKILVKCVPYQIRDDATGSISARDWDGAKEAYADHVLGLLARDYVTNVESAVLERVVHSPVDQERHISSAVRGTELQGAFLPYQSGAMRPIPELGQYRAPVPNVYLCCSGSHPGPGVSFMPGRNAAQVIHADLGLDFAATAAP